MLVDDHQTMLWGLSKLIDGEQPRMKVVATANCFEQALERTEHLVPDVILLDLDLGADAPSTSFPSCCRTTSRARSSSRPSASSRRWTLPCCAAPGACCARTLRPKR